MPRNVHFPRYLLSAVSCLPLFGCPPPPATQPTAVTTPDAGAPCAECPGETRPTRWLEGEPKPAEGPCRACPEIKAAGGPERPKLWLEGEEERNGDAPPAIATAGVPPIPAEVKARLRQYSEVRSARFQGFGPDGAVLVLTRFADTAQLHLVPMPGGRREQLTFQDEPIAEGFFAPNTPDIYFLQGKGGNENNQIYRFDRKTGRAALLTDGKSRHTSEALAKSGAKLAYTGSARNGRDHDIYVMDLKSGSSERVLEVDGDGAAWGVRDFSPDETKLLLQKGVSANEDYPFVLDLKTKKKTAIPIPGGGKAAQGALAFSADGKGVYVSSNALGEFKTLGYFDLASQKYTWLTEKISWDVTSAVVLKDKVAFVTNEDGRSRLYLWQKGAYAAVETPLGVIGDLALSPDEKRLGFTLYRPDAPADAYTYEIADKKLIRWTYSEVGGLDPAGFVVPELVRYKTFDGREIPAYYFKPRGAKRSPVVIQIHGGPEGQYLPTFSGSVQYLVNELGIAVLAPNVRGSSGYGKTYLALDDVEKREDSVKDIGALLDWISGRPELDSSRVAVQGGSYGGYMVLASLVMFGDRIRAGVDIVGIANFTTFLEKTSPYRVDLRRVEYGDERKPEVKALFERISPANNAEKITAALLVAHGKNDPRVPFFEAELIAKTVREVGRPVWTVFADNEGHGFRRKENVDYLSAATTVFFQQYLLK